MRSTEMGDREMEGNLNTQAQDTTEAVSELGGDLGNDQGHEVSNGNEASQDLSSGVTQPATQPVTLASAPSNPSLTVASMTQANGAATSSTAASVAPMGAKTATNTKTKIIKRYQNRKLYDTQQSCYVTLDDIAKMIRTNEDVMVIDNKTKNDITAATLTQIVFEAEKKASQYAPLFTLREIIQNANGSISSYLAKLGAFPKDYAKQEQPSVALNAEKASYDDMKQTLENRVAKAAAGETTDFGGNKFVDDQTPSLPNSNKSLNQ